MSIEMTEHQRTVKGVRKDGFRLNPFGGPLAIELAVAFTTITNLVLTVTRWREYGKALSAEVNNCPV